MCTLPTPTARAGAQDTGRLKQLADSISGATITQSSGPLPCRTRGCDRSGGTSRSQQLHAMCVCALVATTVAAPSTPPHSSS